MTNKLLYYLNNSSKILRIISKSLPLVKEINPVINYTKKHINNNSKNNKKKETITNLNNDQNSNNSLSFFK